jgi:hypothetical protein
LTAESLVPLSVYHKCLKERLSMVAVGVSRLAVGEGR